MTSKIKVDNITNQSDSNIVNKCGTTITLGASGDTINLASGASQTGFGRTGTVDWDTTKKTSAFTAVNGDGFFIDTSSAAITMTLPASPSAGDIVAFKDYAGTFTTNNLTIARNGSNLDGSAVDKTINTNNTSMSLIYVDATQGWKSVEEGTGYIGEDSAFVTATGGTETTCGDYKIHTFTGPGTFTVSCGGNSVGSNSVDYMVVAGGGGGGGENSSNAGAGGAGAGGYRESSGAASGCYTASPLGACVSALPVSVQGYPITVGGGGPGGFSNSSYGTNGSVSTFSSITSAGGGFGGSRAPGPAVGNPGGSGGGGGLNTTGGTGNTPPVSPPQGQTGGGGGGGQSAGAGGGGAGAVGGCAPSNFIAGNGATGVTSSINATPTTRAGGGGGGGGSTGGTGGSGGGGNGSTGSGYGAPGSANTGGGGGGAYDTSSGGTGGGGGGSGIVIIRYKFQ